MPKINEWMMIYLDKSLFYFDLPKDKIAQTPVEPRDSSKLLVIDRDDKSFENKHFFDIVDYLEPGDLLVLNDSKVLPARLIGVKSGFFANVELLLIEEKEKDVWEVLIKPAKRVKIGSKIIFNEGLLIATVIDVLQNGSRMVKFDYVGDFYSIIHTIGYMPLPHYITHNLENSNRYQTVYSKMLGSVAAPTAGLHFTNDLLAAIKNKGVNIKFITLHVGIGTFRPVSVNDLTKHQMHFEYYYLSKDTADAIIKTKKNKNKVIAVGTTTCRTLESVADSQNGITESSGKTNIFIYPPYDFKIVDALITNFHLPESTLMMLVSALASRELILKAYDYAINNEYRFYSFGDAMLIK